jgi:biopolymer transport protein ExbD
MDLKVVASNREFRGVSMEKLKKWAREGRIAPRDLVRPSGTQDWIVITQVSELATLLPLPAAKTVPRPSLPEVSETVHAADPTYVENAEEEFADVPVWTPQRSRRGLEEASMDMTPMIDVTFQLLIFFMFANQLANPVPIVVPEAIYGRGVTPDGKQMILIDANAQYYLGESTKPENISPSLESLAREVQTNALNQGGPMDVIINAHKGSKYVDLRQLMDRLSQVEGLGKVMVGVTEKQ